MSLHINKFIDRLKSAESKNQRDIFMTINEARDLHGDITKLLLALEVLRNEPQAKSEDYQTIEIKGGTF